MKPKPLLRSLVEKKRYIAFEILSDGKLSSSPIPALKDGMTSFLGVQGMGKAGVIFLNEKYDAALQRGIVRVGNRHVDAVKSAFLFVKKIGVNDVIVRSVCVSGMLGKAERAMRTDISLKTSG